MQTFSSLLLIVGTCLTLGFAPPASAATTGSGRMATEQRAVSGFEAVATSGSIDLVLRQDRQGGGRECRPTTTCCR